MTTILIKIGHQDQADEPIFLHPNGKIVCGNFEYSGRFRPKFRDIYNFILDLVDQRPPNGIVDVSAYRSWNAMDIYEEYIAKPWKKSIDAKTLERLSNETCISQILDEVRIEFKRAVAAKWKKVFRNSDINDPATPTQGWHLFKNPRTK